LLLVYALGYSATGWTLGPVDPAQTNAWVVAFLAGWAILCVIALGLILGGLTRFAAALVGLGALVVAIWRPVAPPEPPPQCRLTLAAGLGPAGGRCGQAASARPASRMRAMDDLSGEELADRSGVTAEQLRRLMELGIITPTPQGRFRRSDVQRIRVVDTLADAGFAPSSWLS
jgi:MerR HTH family regulatory protein